MDLQQATKAALAAAVAWLAALPLGGMAGDYAFYAPLGAVVAVATTVVGSVRGSVQAICAIACGAVLATAVIPLPAALGLVIVVGVGTLLVEFPVFRHLDGSASWVPISGMFVLILGGDSPWDYAAAYLGLVTFGAVIGLVVNALWPPMALNATDRALKDLRGVLAAQLEGIAQGLRGERPPTPDEWADRLRTLEPSVERMRRIAEQTYDSGRLNWRFRRWPRNDNRGCCLPASPLQVCAHARIYR